MKKYLRNTLVIGLVVSAILPSIQCTQKTEKKCFLPSTGALPIPGQTKEQCNELMMLDIVSRNLRGNAPSDGQRALQTTNCLITHEGTTPYTSLAFLDNSDLTSLTSATTVVGERASQIFGLSDVMYDDSSQIWVGVGMIGNGRTVFYSNSDGSWEKAVASGTSSSALTTISKDSSNRFVGRGINDAYFRSSRITDFVNNYLTPNTLGSTQRFFPKSSAFGSDKIVFVGNARSADLVFTSHITYTSNGGSSFSNANSHLNSSTPLNEVIYGGNVFVSVGNSGLITTSSDGITWSAQNHGGADLFGIAYGNNRYVAVGNDNRILTTTNPTNPGSWQSVTVSGIQTGSTIQSVAFDRTNNRFIALANTSISGLPVSGKRLFLLTSSDGSSWTVSNPNQESGFYSKIRCK